MIEPSDRVIELLSTGEHTPNYAALVNEMPELFTLPDEWLQLGAAHALSYYPKLSEYGRKVFNELYSAGKLDCEFPGISPTTLQNYCPHGMKSWGAIREGIFKGEGDK